MDNIWVLAQAAGDQASSGISSETVAEQGEATTVAPDSNAPKTSAPANKMPGYGNMLFLALMFVVMYLLLFRGPQKQKQQHKKMIQTLEKNDKVRTVGGIIGTVVDIRDDEVTLKVDESNNTKIKIAPSAIGKNLTKEKD